MEEYKQIMHPYQSSLSILQNFLSPAFSVVFEWTMRFIRGDKTPKRASVRKPWGPKLSNKRGRPFPSAFQYAIYLSHKNFERERDNGGPLFPLQQVR